MVLLCSQSQPVAHSSPAGTTSLQKQVKTLVPGVFSCFLDFCCYLFLPVFLYR